MRFNKLIKKFGRVFLILFLIAFFVIIISKNLDKKPLETPCQQQTKESLFTNKKANLNVYLPENNTQMFSDVFKFSLDYFNWFENQTGIKVTKNINLYFVRNVSKCCHNYFGCAGNDTAILAYPYEGFNDIHELNHIIFSDDLQIPINSCNSKYNQSDMECFGEVFNDKMWDLFYFDNKHHDSGFKIFMNCSDKRKVNNMCNYTSIFDREQCKNKFLIRKIDCVFNRNNKTIEYENWIDFIKQVKSKKGIKTRKELYELFNKQYGEEFYPYLGGWGFLN